MSPLGQLNAVANLTVQGRPPDPPTPIAGTPRVQVWNRFLLEARGRREMVLVLRDRKPRHRGREAWPDWCAVKTGPTQTAPTVPVLAAPRGALPVPSVPQLKVFGRTNSNHFRIPSKNAAQSLPVPDSHDNNKKFSIYRSPTRLKHWTDTVGLTDDICAVRRHFPKTWNLMVTEAENLARGRPASGGTAGVWGPDPAALTVPEFFSARILCAAGKK